MDSAMEGILHISDGNPNVLNANRNDDGRWLNANWDDPQNRWNDNGAFAFLVSATLFISPPARGSFVSRAVLATHLASCQHPRFFPRAQRIFSYQAICFPRAP